VLAVCDGCASTYHAVMHDLVPVFTGDNAKQQHDRIQRCLEVGLSAINKSLHLW